MEPELNIAAPNRSKKNHNSSTKIGPIPRWITSWGIVMIIFLLSVILLGGFLISFPDIIPARVIISTSNPPVKIVSRSTGLISQMHVGNNQLVNEGQVISVLANPARYEDVQVIAAIIPVIDTARIFSEQMKQLKIRSGLQLGELQSSYSEVIHVLQQYQYFITKNNYHSRIEQLQKQADLQTALSLNLREKKELLRQRSQLQFSRYLMDSGLITARVISGLEYEESRKRMIDQKLSESSNEVDILQSYLNVVEYQKSISEQNALLQNEENVLQIKLKQAARQFQGAFSQWEQKYVLRSPISGKVSFFKFWKENQFVNSGESVFMVTPLTHEYVVKGSVGIIKAGKIKENQKILIKLTAYPFEEFGMLEGSVRGLSQVYMEDSFYLDISLDKGLLTNSGKPIPPQYLLNGTGEIITNDKSFFQRLLETLTTSMRE